MDFSCAVILTNRNYRIKSWNRAAEGAYGWTADEAVGKNLDELLKTAYLGGSYGEAYAALLTAGRVSLNVLHTAKDGKTLPMSGTASLSRNGDGEITGIVHVYRDSEATPGEGAKAQPARLPEKPGGELLQMLQGLAEDLWVYDISSNTEWHSSRTVDRRSGEGPAGFEESGAVHPDDWEQVDEALKQATTGGQERFRLQYRARAEDGSYAWTLNQGRIEYDGEGRPIRMYGTATDISALKAEEQALHGRIAELDRRVLELVEKNRLMTDFFTNVSHEFKTPLSIMLVDLQLMEYRLRDATGGDLRDKLGKTVSIMRQNALRLLRLIGNLLDVTKVEAGFMKARLINADAVALVAGLTESVRNYAKNAGIHLEFRSDKSSKLMPVDSDKLERIMLNLLSNAIKHTGEGGHITVSMRTGQTSIVISVKDDGEGIAEDKKELVFDRFRQVNTSLTRMSDGCGIGLALTRALVELLKGKIWFESKVGEGSEFFVELPVLQADWQTQPPEVDGLPRDRKVEMEFSDINRIERG